MCTNRPPNATLDHGIMVAVANIQVVAVPLAPPGHQPDLYFDVNKTSCHRQLEQKTGPSGGQSHCSNQHRYDECQDY